MALFDMVCHECNVIVEDIYCESASQLQEQCPKCGRALSWKPYVRTQSTKASFFCEQAGKRFHNYASLERWAAANGKTIVSTKEHERTNFNRPDYEQRIMGERRDLKEAVKKSHYRLKHGYVDHPKLDKER